MSDDAAWMRRAIALARENLGRTGENPSVGCVIVAGGRAVGEGATGEGGRPHAEEVALDQAGDAARGATAYVTLEPCGRRSAGRAACGVRLAQAGVARVVVAAADPGAFASGRGLGRLRESGAQIDLGVLASEAMEGLYAGYAPGRPERGK
jgi:diaminohydroxyphosphoribosylaminopyrimidine deaminase/5-amino-6-(5-phosphoribosylamino)uracil reductase